MLAGNDANVRIREINGKGVSMVFADDVVIPSGTTRMGLFAWSGMGPSASQVAVCVEFVAMPSQRYLVAVGGYRRNFELTMKAVLPSGTEKEFVPQRATYRAFEPDILPCEGVK